MLDHDDSIVVHPHPLLKSEANWIQHAAVRINGEETLEQLWFNRGLEGLELCCVPFFLYNVALHDIVEIDSNRELTVVKSSGRYVFRVFILRDPPPTREFMKEIEKGGARCELDSAKFLAIDAPNEEVGNRIWGYLEELKEIGYLEYENGCPLEGMPIKGR